MEAWFLPKESMLQDRFRGGTPSGTPLVEVSENLWQATVVADAGDVLEFKFINGITLGAVQNRFLRVVAAAMDTVDSIGKSWYWAQSRGEAQFVLEPVPVVCPTWTFRDVWTVLL